MTKLPFPPTDPSTSTPAQATNLPPDPWLCSSLLQKSIRRGDADTAADAGVTLHRLRGSSIWTRLLVIAFEDIGAASPGVLVNAVIACTDIVWRKQAGGNAAVVSTVARMLADAPKDRSSDYLICTARGHPSLAQARQHLAGLPVHARIDMAADTTLPVTVRATAAWFASGIEWGQEQRVGPGDLENLLATFQDLGVPGALLEASGSCFWVEPGDGFEDVPVLDAAGLCAATTGGDKNVYIIPGEWNCNTLQAASAENRTTVHQSHAQVSEVALVQGMKKLGENWQTLSMTGDRLILRCEQNTFMAVKLAPGAAVSVDLRKTNSVLNPYLGIIQIRGKFLRNSSRQDGSCFKTLAEAKQNSNWGDKDEQVALNGTVFTIPSIPSFDYEIYYHIKRGELWLMDGNEVFQNGFMRAPGRPEVDPNSPWLRAFRYPIE